MQISKKERGRYWGVISVDFRVLPQGCSFVEKGFCCSKSQSAFPGLCSVPWLLILSSRFHFFFFKHIFQPKQWPQNHFEQVPKPPVEENSFTICCTFHGKWQAKKINKLGGRGKDAIQWFLSYVKIFMIIKTFIEYTPELGSLFLEYRLQGDFYFLCCCKSNA